MLDPISVGEAEIAEYWRAQYRTLKTTALSNVTRAGANVVSATPGNPTTRISRIADEPLQLYVVVRCLQSGKLTMNFGLDLREPLNHWY
jgi:hypothetical protein